MDPFWWTKIQIKSQKTSQFHVINKEAVLPKVIKIMTMVKYNTFEWTKKQTIQSNINSDHYGEWMANTQRKKHTINAIAHTFRRSVHAIPELTQLISPNFMVIFCPEFQLMKSFIARFLFFILCQPGIPTRWCFALFFYIVHPVIRFGTLLISFLFRQFRE
jgi:hypothetical protein